MLLEIAIGDAYGAGFEYAADDLVRTLNTLAGYVRHRRHHNVPGTYTDDTQMSIAVAEAIVEEAPWTKNALAHRFVRAFKRDPRKGYARSFHEFLQGVDDGDDFLARIRPDSDKSGAAMRAMPVGLFPSVSIVLDRARTQAKVTHDTPDGIAAAQAAAIAAHYFAYGLGPREEVGVFVADHVPGQWAVPWNGKVGPKGWMSVRAALTALAGADSLSRLLRDCVAFTGDVDTVAAVAMGAASCSREIARDLPAHLLDGLESGPYGRAFIESLDRQLLGRFGFAPVAPA